MSKHKTTTKKDQVFTFNKLTFTNPPEFYSIEKPKEVIKKTKPLNKNSEIFKYFFEQKIKNSTLTPKTTITTIIHKIFLTLKTWNTLPQ
jgi:hypothetical protein